jgi:8-oxo-dGTP diphosphatase
METAVINQNKEELSQDSSESPDKKSPHVGVGVFLVDPVNEKFLFGRRKDNQLYAQPGGWLEFGESLEECGSRELMEETGLVISPERIKHVKTLNCFNPKDNYHNVAVYLYVEIKEEEKSMVVNVEPHKCEEWIWVDYDFLIDNYDKLFFPIQVFLRKAGNKYKSIVDLRNSISI